ncbi:hypothetical protein [Ascidiaceihabitans sp.]|uniref:hypothetical protein n=1 Tax=Ascidiaceihabitans sp. TaxID=1872644 RepID=UPI003299809B
MDTVDFISPERLKTFEKQTDRQEKAVALHNHTLQLGSSLMSMIALLELSLRNSTNQRLIESFSDTEWLLPGHASIPLKAFEKNAISSAIAHARKAAYAKLSYKEKAYLDAFAFPSGKPADTTHKVEVRKRQSLFVVSQGQVISQTTFSFWKRLYSAEYDATLWKTCLKRVFPDKKLKRSDVSVALETIYATRNRVAHHEPVYGARLEEAMNALEMVRNSLGASSATVDTSFKKFSRIQYLRLRMDYESFVEAWQTLT